MVKKQYGSLKLARRLVTKSVQDFFSKKLSACINRVADLGIIECDSFGNFKKNCMNVGFIDSR